MRPVCLLTTVVLAALLLLGLQGCALLGYVDVQEVQKRDEVIKQQQQMIRNYRSVAENLYAIGDSLRKDLRRCQTDSMRSEPD